MIGSKLFIASEANTIAQQSIAALKVIETMAAVEKTRVEEMAQKMADGTINTSELTAEELEIYKLGLQTIQTYLMGGYKDASFHKNLLVDLL